MSANFGVNIDGRDIEKFFRWLKSWTKNKEKGMTVDQFYKKIKKKFPDMTRDIFHQYLDDLRKSGKVKVYPGKRNDYVIVNPEFKRRPY